MFFQTFDLLHMYIVSDLFCPYCYKGYSRKDNLRNHIRDIHENAGKVFTCQICFKTSKSESALRMHHTIYHKHSVTHWNHVLNSWFWFKIFFYHFYNSIFLLIFFNAKYYFHFNYFQGISVLHVANTFPEILLWKPTFVTFTKTRENLSTVLNATKAVRVRVP